MEEELFSAHFVNIVQKFIDSIRRENLLKTRTPQLEPRGESEGAQNNHVVIQVEKLGTQSKNQDKCQRSVVNV